MPLSPLIPTTPWLVTWQPLLLYLLNIVALAIHPRYQIFRVALSLPILIILVLQSLSRDFGENFGFHYALNCAVGMLVCVYMDWVVLGRPDKEGWQRVADAGVGKETQHGKTNGEIKEHGKANGQVGRSREAFVPQDFWKRVWWGVRLTFASTRYVGWSCQVKNVPSMRVHASYPRTVFIARGVLRTVIYYLLRDALLSYIASSPHGSWQDVKHKTIVGLSGYSLTHRLYIVWVHIIISYVNLEMTASAFNLICVVTGLSPPRDCPTTFGHVRDLYTLRKAWSVVWHQMCRRGAATPGTLLARDVLRLRKGSFASKYVQLFVAFGISGVVHALASMLTLGSFHDDAAMVVYILQAVIIMVEDHVIDFGKRMGLRDSLFWCVVGFIWTVFILGVSLEPWVGALLENGIWINSREMDWFGLGPQK
ncbi:hypothetical protein NX059_008588 [Plenodomus lindquistii]|nr:hypothetical protein NX059_008588 [Plenodomus lindquistii]